jgi:uncharacterized membrane-anchored protein
VTPSVDSVIVNKPNTDGYVKFDDWDKGNRDDEIEVIWDSMVLGLEAQSEKLGTLITAERWHIYPTLDKERKVLYYATLINWDGSPTININASVFDRRGYVEFQIVPIMSDITAETTKKIVEEVLNIYKAEEGQKYTQFITGDKIAAAGVVGVLATLVGVKYGKGAAAGLIAIILVFAKKAWFLLLLPFIYLKKFFNRKE